MKTTLHKETRNASNLRVVFFSDAIQNRNGVGTYYQDLVEHLQDYLEHVELVCPGSTHANNYHPFSFSLPGDPTQKLYLPKIWQLSKKTRQITPHIIIIPTPGPYGILGFGLMKRMGVRLCAGFHTEYEKLADLYWDGMFGSLSKTYLKWLHKILFHSSSVVVTNSTDMVETAQESGAHDVKLVGTPIARHFLDTPVSPLSSQLRSIFYAGRLAPEKNIDVIMQAVERLAHIRFVIAGDGPLRDIVEERSQCCHNLEYVGWVSRKEIMAILDRTDMLILPSTVESFGTIALEAMARKRLVLISQNCGILDWPSLAQGIFQIQKEETLTEAIQRIERLDSHTKNHKAEVAYTASRAFNAKTLEQWLDIFSRTLSQIPHA